MSILVLQPAEATAQGTYVVSHQPSINFGADTTFLLGRFTGESDFTARVLLRFDASALPAGATINSATLTLFNTGNATFFAEGVTRQFGVRRSGSAWVEMEATWTHFDASTIWPGGNTVGNPTGASDSGELLDDGDNLVIDITDIVQEAYANFAGIVSMVLHHSGDEATEYGGLEVYSSGSPNPLARPKLVIDFTPPPLGFVNDPDATITLSGQVAPSPMMLPVSNPIDVVLSGGGTTQVFEDDIEWSDVADAHVRTDAQIAIQNLPPPPPPLPGEVIPNPVRIRYASENEAIGTVNDNGYVTRQSNGTVGIIVKNGPHWERVNATLFDTPTVTARTFTDYVAGSLAKEMSDQVDNRIAGLTPTMENFNQWVQPVDYAHGIYVRSPDLWCADVDLTALSPWNSAEGRKRAGTLITKRHMIQGAHYCNGPGDTVHFVTNDNVTIVRTVIARKGFDEYLNEGGKDICICKFDSDLPASIGFVKFLPSTWPNYLPHLYTSAGLADAPPYYSARIPVAFPQQSDYAAILDAVNAHPTNNFSPLAAPPLDPTRLQFYMEPISGDSSSPIMFFTEDDVILWLLPSSALFTRTDHMNCVVDYLASFADGYTVTYADLSGYTDYGAP